MSARGLYRGYWSGGKRAGQVRRLHIVREDGPKGWAPGKQTMCGQGAWDVTHSDAVILDPLPDRPPEGWRGARSASAISLSGWGCWRRSGRLLLPTACT